MAYRAVLFDWMLTLAHYPRWDEWIERAAADIGRALDDATLATMIERLEGAQDDPDVRRAMIDVDLSARRHAAAERLFLERAGVDTELAEAMYDVLGRPDFHPVYPEVPGVLEALAGAGMRVVVVSDIHIDLREHARLAGIDPWIHDWVLSFEHGVQKPELRIFELALEAAGVPASEALMVGDRSSHDGGADELGIDCLILPARERDPVAHSDRLDGVLRLTSR